MRGKLKHLPPAAARSMAAFYRRQRLYAFLRALLTPLLCWLAAGLVAMHADRFLFLGDPVRLWISRLTHGGALAAGVVALAAFAWRRGSVRRLAYELEALLPGGTAERLVTLEDVRRQRPGEGSGPVHADLLAQLERETVAACEGCPSAGRLVRDRLLKRKLLATVLLGLAWLGFHAWPGYQFDLMVQRWLGPTRNLAKPGFIQLTVTPEAPLVGRGNELVLQVRTEGRIPWGLEWLLRRLGADPGRCLLVTAPGRVERLPVPRDARSMSRVQRHLFVGSLTDLQESFSFRVRCGDAQSSIRFGEVVRQPRATEARVRVTPPAYTGLMPTETADLLEPVPAFPGSQVEFSFRADQPLAASRLVDRRDDGVLAALQPDPESGLYAHTFEMQRSMEVDVELVNEKGFENVDPVRLIMALRQDQPPGVRLEYPAGDLTVVQGELVPMRMDLSDDLGLLEAALRYQINPELNPEAPFRELPVDLDKDRAVQTVEAVLDLETAGTAPGDELLLWVRVRDTARQDALSQPIRIRVTAFAGNENERRRLQALRLAGRVLQAVVVADEDAGGDTLRMDAEAYGREVEAATAGGLELAARPTVGSLLDFLEWEHHFSDSADAKRELRLLRGVVSASFDPPLDGARAPAGERLATLRRLADEVVPGLLHERLGRDLMSRALGLRAEVAALATRLREQDRDAEAARAQWPGQVQALALQIGQRALQRAELAPLYPALETGRREQQRLRTARDRLDEEIEAMIRTGGDMDKIDALEVSREETEKAYLAAFDVIVQAENDMKPVLAGFVESLTADRVGVDPARDTAFVGAIASAVWKWKLDPAVPEAATGAALPAAVLAGVVRTYAAQGPGTTAADGSALKRRIGLLLDVMNETGRDLAGLARTAGQPDLNAVLGFSEQISLAGRELGQSAADRRQAACASLEKSLSGWEQLLLPVLPGWQEERFRAGTALQQADAAVRLPLVSAWRSDALPDGARRWLADDARLRERNPFSGFADRLEAVSPGAGAELDAAGAAALAVDAACQHRLAARGQDVPAGGIEIGGEPFASDALAVMARLAEPAPGHAVAFDALSGEAAALQARVAPLRPPADVDAMPAFAESLAQVIPALERLYIEADRLGRRLHLDVSARDPRTPSSLLLAAALPSLRETLNRWQATVPELLDTLQQRSRQVTAGAGDLSAITLDLEDLARRVGAFGSGLSRTADVLRQASPATDESAQVAELRAIYSAVFGLAEGAAPAEVMAELFAAYPSAAAIAVRDRLPVVAAMSRAVADAETALKADPADIEAFRTALEVAVEGLLAVEPLLGRVQSLDKEGAVLALAVETRRRLEGLRLEDLSPAADVILRHRVALDGLRRQAEALDHQFRDLAQAAVLPVSGWWGGPAGVWEGASRRDAEHARRRMLAQVNRAREETILAWVHAAETGTLPPGEALAWAVFAWRAVHSTLGGDTVVRRVQRAGEEQRDPLLRWLLDELDQTRNSLRRMDRPRRYREPTQNWVESVSGFLRY